MDKAGTGTFRYGGHRLLFSKIGLLIKEKNGYLYPVSEQAASVLDVLRYELQTLGVEIIYGCKVQKVERTLSGKLVVNDGDREWQFDAVILTCGGKAAPGTGSDGSGWKIAKKLVIPVLLLYLRWCSSGVWRQIF